MCNILFYFSSTSDDDSRGPLILHDLVVVEGIALLYLTVQ